MQHALCNENTPRSSWIVTSRGRDRVLCLELFGNITLACISALVRLQGAELVAPTLAALITSVHGGWVGNIRGHRRTVIQGLVVVERSVTARPARKRSLDK